MKTSIVLGSLFLVSGAAALAAYAVQSSSEGSPTAVAEAPAAEKTMTLSVPGMHCEFACAPKVRETLAAVPGVNSVETNVDEKTATIVVGDRFEMETAVAKLEEAGYPVKSQE